jgi:large subunit ribosomal protein L4e
MFAPLKIWRKWHRKVNLNQKRNAVASALAAAACAPLVQARGHRIESVPELPLVVNSLNSGTAKGMISALNNLGAQDDVMRVRKSKRTRKGIGKMKNGRFTFRKGPLVIYGDDNPLVKRGARNCVGVEVCHVSRINLLQLAPGGHIGRFIIFTKDAFEKLDSIFGTHSDQSVVKKRFSLGRSMMACADLARIINSDQVQSKLRDIRTSVRVHDKTKKNPLKNKVMMQKINPYSNTARDLEQKAQEARKEARNATLAKNRSKVGRAAKAKRTLKFNMLANGLEESFKDAQKIIDDEIKAGLFKEDDSEEEEEDDE